MALLLRGNTPQKALEHLGDALQSDPNLIDAVQLRALVRARLADPAALDDVERLIQSPTPYHLYNAACALAVYSEKANEPRCAVRALDVLARALDAGVPPSEAAADSDLKALHQSVRFEQIVTRRADR
jgi:eukaryotic-like serine/threonine-protein kinase